MTLQELVYKLTDIINSGEGNDRLQVRVNAPTGNKDCWLEASQITIESAHDEAPFVRISGGIGA